ncbi:MAG: OmpA family protein, partial [Pseudomonadota bacterium]|nr:OmpA family protein [Pseudomonadota bacterium]
HGQDGLSAQARSVLRQVAQDYRAAGAMQVVLSGHTDRSGGDANNIGLSQRRAQAVREYLTTLGVPEGVMTTQAFGETRNAVETADGVREPDNNRVEITFGPGSGW